MNFFKIISFAFFLVSTSVFAKGGGSTGHGPVTNLRIDHVRVQSLARLGSSVSRESCMLGSLFLRDILQMGHELQFHSPQANELVMIAPGVLARGNVLMVQGAVVPDSVVILAIARLSRYEVTLAESRQFTACLGHSEILVQ